MHERADHHQRGLLIAFEGGTVHTAERNGMYLLIINQAALLDMLDEQDREGIEAIRELVFPTAAAREEYIQERGWRIDIDGAH
jgi:hypothetical protein